MSETTAPTPIAAPNPLGTGDIHLTLPTRRSRRAAASRPVTEPDPVPADSTGEPVHTGDSAAAADGLAAPSPGDSDAHPVRESEADDSEAAQGDPEEPAGPAGRPGVDRQILRSLAALVGVVAVIAGLVWWFVQPSTPPAPVHTIAAPPGAALPVTSTVPAAPADGPVPITLTAVCPGQTDPKLAASTDHRSGWVCPTGGVPFGQKLVVTLATPAVITGIKLWPGFNGAGADGRDEWSRHRLLSEVQFVFNDRDLTMLPGSPNGERREYALVVNHLVASQVEMTVLDSVPAPPQPTLTPTAAAPRADPAAVPELASIFATGPADGANAPDAASIAVTGFQLIGHPIA